ncbi:16S rRNA (cytosine(967)-C(5))-methyltransferase RsmB [Feifania hominis]|uniref:16S rRNA (cytosine(967)-C(5))-methyltransferase n=1 Tax=Feifania hominis TaxID=2763660 RepID=A0A926DFR8_9FIRM|nr:16S rRNA (cytosine(967)-C(5))-methyltransferase RsmB [Feifania hominis]
MTDARQTALSAALTMRKTGGYSNLVLSAQLARAGLPPLERGLAAELFYGALERRRTLDYYIARYSGRRVETLDAAVQEILRQGMYQLLYLTRIPPSAACNESVRLAARHAARAKGFVNAVLRAAARGLSAAEPPDSLAVRCSVSDSIAGLLCHQYGEETEAMLMSFFERGGTDLTVNTLRTTPAALASRFAQAGVEAVENDAGGLTIPASGDITKLPGFAEGLFFVQDTASRLTAWIARPAPGQTVFDLCAAPGGKSFLMALAMGDEGRILSFDCHGAKLPLIRDGAARLGLASIETRLGDAAVFDPSLSSAADLVLCDVPCSGLGVMRKKPEIRYKEVDDFKHLPKTQLAILENGARYVRPGGALLYSTCTLNRRENEGVVEAFLSAHDDFRPVDGWELLPRSFVERRDDSPYVRLLPQIHATDGFFFCKMIHR